MRDLAPLRELKNSPTPVARTFSSQAREPHPVASRAGFAALCVFLATQAYTIPVLLVGPSWAVWPMPTDFATAVLVGAALCLPPSRDARLQRYRRGVGALFAFCAASFFVFVIVPMYAAPPIGGTGSMNFGAFHVVRLVEFWLGFAAALRVPLSPKRLLILRWIAFAVVAWLVASVFLTYLEVLRPHDFAPWIPKSKNVSGAWSFYANTTEGVGTVGYNHAYTASQITLVTGLVLQLGARSHGWRSVALLLASLVAVFMSGSRAGLAGHLLFVVGYLATRPAWLIGGGAAAALAFAVIGPQVQTNRTDREMLSRQLGAADPLEKSNLSGRDHIWEDRIVWLNDNPRAWAVGAGLGGTADTGGSAHMLPLQIIAELGIVGLFLCCVAFGRLGADLVREYNRVPALFWCTAGLLLSSTTQETFYPQPAMGQFLGFYLVVLAIVFREPTVRRGVASQAVVATPPASDDGGPRELVGS